jgi:ABC-2 type transport system permease protein
MEAAPADPTAAPHVPRRSRAVRFGGSATAVLFGKELKLLGRDPELIS